MRSITPPVKLATFILFLNVITGGVNSFTVFPFGFYFGHALLFLADSHYRSYFEKQEICTQRNFHIGFSLLVVLLLYLIAAIIDSIQLIFNFGEPLPYWQDPLLLGINTALAILGLVMDLIAGAKPGACLLVPVILSLSKKLNVRR